MKKLKEYAKVEDNFAAKDKGKERFIGQIGLVMQVDHDYSCFSQVLLKFKDGSTEWFSNTTLKEIGEDGGKKLVTVEEVMESIVTEYKRITRNSKPFISPGDGWVALQRHIDDLWESIRRDSLREASMKAECLAVQALRFVIDIRNREKDEEDEE